MPHDRTGLFPLSGARSWIGTRAAVVLIVQCVFSSARADSASDPAYAVRNSSGDQIYWVEQVADGLKFPSSMLWLPNGDMLIAEREGGIRTLRGGRLNPSPFGGVPVSFQNAYNGLRDILLDPDYERNQTLYLSISEGTFERHHVAVYRAQYRPAGLKGVEQIFRCQDDVHGERTIAGRMLFLSDKTLLVAITSENFDKMAQALDSHQGKILRINRDGSIPTDNPFIKTPGALPEIWTRGHRVQYGLYQDRDSGAVWEVETGPNGGDELNLLEVGANFGWMKASWGFDYNNAGLIAPLQSAPDVENPILVWMPSVTPSGLARNTGTVYPRWTGDYFVGHLTGKALERIRIDASNRVVLQEKLLMDLQERIRDVKMGPDNRIYVLTDHQDGRVLRLLPGEPTRSESARNARRLKYANKYRPNREDLEMPLTSADLAKGEEVFRMRCAACHGIGKVVTGGNIGPDLAGIYGRKPASAAGFTYSKALLKMPLDSWQGADLDAFIADPGAVQGTKMAAPGVLDPQERRKIVGFLKQHSGQ